MVASFLFELRVRKLLRWGDPIAPAAMQQGDLVKALGVVRAAEEPWQAPFSGASCVAFWTRSQTAGRADNAYRVDLIERSQPFWLDCADGPVWVRPEGWARFLSPRNYYQRDDPLAWGCYNAFTERYGLHLREELGGFAEGLTFLERRIEVGDRVAVVGEVTEPHIPDASSQRGGGYRARIVAPSLWPPASGQLWVSSYEAHLE